MSTIKTNPAIPGAVATAAGVNATYTAIQTGTAALTDINEQTEWATFSHLNGVTNDTLFTTDMQTFCNPNDTYTLTSESYVVINLAGTTPVRVSYAPTLTYTSGNELLRVHADINLDAVSEAFALPAVLMNDQDCFFLQLWYRDGTNAYHAVDCEWAYSVTNYTNFDATAIAFDTQPDFDASGLLQTYAESHPRHRLRCSVTGFIPIVASGINRVELRARLQDNAVLPSVRFKEATMITTMIRH